MQVTQHIWGQESPIQRVDIRKLESGMLEAYIHAPSNAGAGDLADVPASLAQRGYSSVADEINGQSLLRVSGFKNESDLMEALSDSNFVAGSAQTQVAGEKEHKSFSEKLGKQTVKLSGVFGIVGHAAMAVAGVLEKDYKRVATALFYTTSTSTSAIYGAGTEDATSKVIGDMKDYLKAQGVEIPQGTQLTAEELAKKGGVIETLHHYIKSHPIEIGNAVGLMGNVMLTYSGLKSGDNVSVGRTASGLASMVGALSVILVPEKAKGGKVDYEWPGMENMPGAAAKDPTAEEIAEKQENRSLPKKFADWVQERPMRFAGLLNVGGNLALFQDAHSISKRHKQTLASYEDSLAEMDKSIASPNSGMNVADIAAKRDTMLGEYDKAKLASRTTAFAYTTAACYLIATAFTSMSSKTKTCDYNEQELVGKLCAMSANLIAEQPQELREEAIDKMALYLCKQEDVKENKQQVVDIINEKVDQIAKSPWMAKVAIERAQSSGAAMQNGVGV